MWQRREDPDIVSLHSAQLNLVLFRSQKAEPSPVALLLYASAPCWNQINPGAKTIDLVFLRFVWSPTLSNIVTMAVRVVCT